MTTTQQVEMQVDLTSLSGWRDRAISALGMFTVEPGASAVRWQFIKQDDGWAWRELSADGGVERTSKWAFGDYQMARQNAIAIGLNPRKHHWTIETELGTTHFHGGRAPAFVPRKDWEPFPPKT